MRRTCCTAARLTRPAICTRGAARITNCVDALLVNARDVLEDLLQHGPRLLGLDIRCHDGQSADHAHQGGEEAHRVWGPGRPGRSRLNTPGGPLIVASLFVGVVAGQMPLSLNRRKIQGLAAITNER